MKNIFNVTFPNTTTSRQRKQESKAGYENKGKDTNHKWLLQHKMEQNPNVDTVTLQLTSGGRKKRNGKTC